MYTYGDVPALLKETTGRYYIDRDIADDALIGTYYYRLAGTGTNVRAAEVGSFIVQADQVTA